MRNFPYKHTSLFKYNLTVVDFSFSFRYALFLFQDARNPISLQFRLHFLYTSMYINKLKDIRNAFTYTEQEETIFYKQ